MGAGLRVVRSALGAACAAALLPLGLAGCGPGNPQPTASASPSAPAGGPTGGQSPSATTYVENGQTASATREYWTTARLEGAQPWESPGYSPSASPAETSPASLRVGALFSHDKSGDHFCTASVVVSPSRDMLITAAHCVHAGQGGTYRGDIMFVPGYRDGTAPNGEWVPKEMFVAAGWAQSSDPALDVAFIVLQPLQGENIEAVLGADKLGVNQGFDQVVHVTGYPGTSEQPITCVNKATQQSPDQMKFDCKGYPTGTSGSPWVMDFDSDTHTGLVIGVIGGYQEGGATPDVSYSPYFGDAVAKLYQTAASQA
jgi:V8-like Glu-specific endopeptidase